MIKFTLCTHLKLHLINVVYFSFSSFAPLFSSLPKTFILVCKAETSFTEESNFFKTPSVLLSKLSNSNLIFLTTSATFDAVSFN